MAWTQRLAVTPPRWLWIVVLGAGVTVSVSLAPMPEDSALWQVLSSAAPFLVVLIMALLSMGMPKDSRLVWWLFTLDQAAEATGDAIYNYQVYYLGQEIEVGPADFFYFVSLACALTGLVLLTHRLQPVKDLAALVDTLILAMAGMSFVVLLNLGPILEEGLHADTFTLVAVMYPILDVAVLAAVIRLLFVSSRQSISLILLAVAYAVYVVDDIIYNSSVVQEAATFPLKWMESGYTLASMIVLAAILAPGARTLADPVEANIPAVGSHRILWLTVGGLAIPLVLMYSIWDESTPVIVEALAFLSFLVIAMVLWRVWSLLKTVEKQSALLKQQARTDSLTNVANRRTLDFHLKRLEKNPNHLFTVAMLDLDFFKQYNDTHGHQKADDLLIDAAQRWKELFPDPALLARYGGEEFTAVIPVGFTDNEWALLEQARESMPDGTTVSIGYATRKPGETASSVVRRADGALYHAKQTGRNRISSEDSYTAL